MTWFASLSWSAAALCVVFCLLLLIGLYLLHVATRKPKRPDVIRRINQFRDG
jgi:hypothetical protein